MTVYLVYDTDTDCNLFVDSVYSDIEKAEHRSLELHGVTCYVDEREVIE